MVARLLIYIVFICGPLIATAVFAVRPRLKAWRLRRMGLLHASQTCFSPECGEHVDPQSPDSLFEGGHWMHRGCRKKLLGC